MPPIRQTSGQFLGNGGTAMFPAGAANGHRDLLLALTKIPRCHASQEFLDSIDELGRAGLGHDIGGDVGGQTRLGTKLRDPVRVRQETHVEDEVGVDRNPTLESEGHHLEGQALVDPLGEGVGRAVER